MHMMLHWLCTYHVYKARIITAKPDEYSRNCCPTGLKSTTTLLFDVIYAHNNWNITWQKLILSESKEKERATKWKNGAHIIFDKHVAILTRFVCQKFPLFCGKKINQFSSFPLNTKLNCVDRNGWNFHLNTSRVLRVRFGWVSQMSKSKIKCRLKLKCCSQQSALIANRSEINLLLERNCDNQGHFLELSQISTICQCTFQWAISAMVDMASLKRKGL